ncbi:unnamed protein product [Parnassius apollo]|uniref:(apollo) hypothetical protein n=1 Tax=Parnassius apollo TaxID=110799 RepID=A0A8S3W162_PARAO|nr:unnamed protein product [Parnassius apollo]
MLRLGMWLPVIARQPAYVDAVVDIPVVVDSDDDGIVPHELEKMRNHIGRGDVGNAQNASRRLPVVFLHTPKQAESGYRAGSLPNDDDLFGS